MTRTLYLLTLEGMRYPAFILKNHTACVLLPAVAVGEPGRCLTVTKVGVQLTPGHS